MALCWGVLVLHHYTVFVCYLFVILVASWLFFIFFVLFDLTNPCLFREVKVTKENLEEMEETEIK